MWTQVLWQSSPVWAWQAPDDLLDAYNLARPSDPLLVWAQLSDDAPYRLMRRA
jgi:hypothetical protein